MHTQDAPTILWIAHPCGVCVAFGRQILMDAVNALGQALQATWQNRFSPLTLLWLSPEAKTLIREPNLMNYLFTELHLLSCSLPTNAVSTAGRRGTNRSSSPLMTRVVPVFGVFFWGAKPKYLPGGVWVFRHRRPLRR